MNNLFLALSLAWSHPLKLQVQTDQRVSLIGKTQSKDSLHIGLFTSEVVDSSASVHTREVVT